MSIKGFVTVSGTVKDNKNQLYWCDTSAPYTIIATVLFRSVWNSILAEILTRRIRVPNLKTIDHIVFTLSSLQEKRNIYFSSKRRNGIRCKGRYKKAFDDLAVDQKAFDQMVWGWKDLDEKVNDEKVFDEMPAHAKMCTQVSEIFSHKNSWIWRVKSYFSKRVKTETQYLVDWYVWKT